MKTHAWSIFYHDWLVLLVGGGPESHWIRRRHDHSRPYRHGHSRFRPVCLWRFHRLLPFQTHQSSEWWPDEQPEKQYGENLLIVAEDITHIDFDDITDIKCIGIFTEFSFANLSIWIGTSSTTVFSRGQRYLQNQNRVLRSRYRPWCHSLFIGSTNRWFDDFDEIFTTETTFCSDMIDSCFYLLSLTWHEKVKS